MRTYEIPPAPTRDSIVLVNLYKCNECGRKFRKGKEQAEREERERERESGLEGAVLR